MLTIARARARAQDWDLEQDAVAVLTSEGAGALLDALPATTLKANFGSLPLTPEQIDAAKKRNTTLDVITQS
jgi:hypothetical protein